MIDAESVADHFQLRIWLLVAWGLGWVTGLEADRTAAGGAIRSARRLGQSTGKRSQGRSGQCLLSG